MQTLIDVVFSKQIPQSIRRIIPITGDNDLLRDVLVVCYLSLFQHHMSCLTWAAGRGHYDVVKILLRCGAKVNTADKVFNLYWCMLLTTKYLHL